MGILNNSNAISVDSGYDITDSLRFRSSASAYLSRTPSSAGNRKTWTWSAWVKRGTSNDQVYFSAGTGDSNYLNVRFQPDYISVVSEDTSLTLELRTSALYRDHSAWYHIVVAIDTTQSTDSNRAKLYVNGEQITSFSSTTYPSLNYDTLVNNTNEHSIGRSVRTTDRRQFDGYLTEVNFVDGQQLTPSDFGESDNNGTWIPKRYTGTYGTNGFYLPMKPTTQATGFNTVLYTGNGATSKNITGTGFSPDFVWIKNRTLGDDNVLQDSVRGVGINSTLISNITNEEGSSYSTPYGYVSALNTNGFSVAKGTNSTYGNRWVNENNSKYVAWCWDAGSSTVTNTNGTIDSQVRANPATGFSIATYTGNGGTATFGHGLGIEPKMVIIKNRSQADGWYVWHTSNSAGVYGYLFLNDTDQLRSSTPQFGSTLPSSSLISLTRNTYDWANASGENYVAYSFADVTGYQKIGSYTGNGSTTGPSVTTGFRPRFVMAKCTNSAGAWHVWDSARQPNNPNNKRLLWNTPDAEATLSGVNIDFNDNGFQLKTSDGALNGSGDTYIYLAIADTTDAQFNFDASGNKNNWTANNINSNASSDSSYDLMADVPTLTDEHTANFPTFNPIAIGKATGGGSAYGATNGNLLGPNTGSGGWAMLGTTMSIPAGSGKFYWEARVNYSGQNMGAGVQVENTPFAGDYVPGYNDANGYGYSNNGEKFNNNTGTSYGSTATTGDYIGVAVDASGTTADLEFFKNGSSMGDAFTGIAGNLMPVFSSTSGAAQLTINFGQQPFAYTPPTGYKKLNTFNLPDSAITDGSEYFVTALYTGNGATRSIDNTITDGSNPQVETGEAIKFGPDFVWLKPRTGAGYHHTAYDTVRGATKGLEVDDTDAEATISDALTSFNSNGFSLGADASDREANESGRPMVAWNWRGSDSTAASIAAGSIDGTNPTIASTVSANTTAGFSIVTYTGSGAAATIGHGLGVIPDMLITKNRTSTGEWVVWHKDLSGAFASNGAYMYLNTTDAAYTTSVFYDGTGISSSVVAFRAGTSSVNNSGSNYVMYAFASVEGYSKFGSYTGNGSTDGPFIYTGFRPAFLLIKRTDSAVNWELYDTARDTYNPYGLVLNPNTSGAEGDVRSGYPADILSNGFKLRHAGGAVNASGGTYIYMAFAENPFKNSNAR